MKQLIAYLILILSVTSVYAQDDSYNTQSRRAQLSDDSLKVDIMVIPANYKLYNSFFDRQMIDENQISFEKLRDTILLSLAREVAVAFADSVPSGVIPECYSPYREDMDFVYESMEYKYEILPEPKSKESTLDKWTKKIKKKDPKPEPRKGTYMENGQIVSNPETRPQYTNAHVLNSDFLYLLNKRYNANTFVFINQYEMVIPQNINQLDIQSDNYPRIIKVHYTITDVNGKEITSGMTTLNSSSFDNKLDYLIGTSFLQIGNQIMMDLGKNQ